jgi:hypothetical protein
MSDPVVDDVPLATFAEVEARLDVRAAREPRGEGAPGPAARRAAWLREAGRDPAAWERVAKGFQALFLAEAASGPLRAAAPIADRFPLVARYGALYSAAKRAALAEPVVAAAPAPGPEAPRPASSPDGAPVSLVDASNQAARRA